MAKRKLKTKKRTKAQEFDFLDFLNAKYGTRDSDADGISDEVERFIGTDPNKVDTDGDGMSDAEEIRRGRNPLGPGDFRDWFVPHAGNNYHPQVLHPKRLLFYAGSAVLIKALVVAFVLTFPLTAWLSPDVWREQAVKVVALTNQLRQSLGVGELTENQRLSQAAYEKATDMVLLQYFAHTGPDQRTLASWLKDAGYRYAAAGENLAMGFSGAEEVMAAWKKSQTHYANLVDKDFTEIGVSALSGPYQGAETTFIAQFFGQPALAAAALNSQVGGIAVSVRVTPPADRLPMTSGQVAPVKVAAAPLANALVKPIIIGLEQETFTKETNLSLNILAPQATTVKVLNNGQTALEKDGADQWRLNLPLTAGQNQVQVIAKRGQQETASDIYRVNLDQGAPTVDRSQTKLWVDLPEGRSEALVRAVAYTESDVKSVRLSFADYKIDLQPVAPQAPAALTRWEGQALVPDRASLQPVLLADLQLTDQAGNTALVNVNWEQAPPSTTSRLKQYLFLRSAPAAAAKPLFDVSSIFFKGLLAVAVLALGLAVFVEIKKQRPKLIASTMGLIVLLIFLIIY